MIKLLLKLSLLILILGTYVFCQNSTIVGKVVEQKNNKPLVGAHAVLTSQTDTTKKYFSTTDSSGIFEITNVKYDKYFLEVKFLGYEYLLKKINVNQPAINLGTLTLSEKAIPMSEVVVEGEIQTAIIKGDTTEYDVRSYKTSRDATAEELVQKMPGVTIESGSVKAQGEDVRQVLVDGRQFFGLDPMLALRTLPSEIIDRVQVFDRLSDQAQLTGYDDGQSIKTMNIVTRLDRRQGQFGRFNAGAGTEQHYALNGNLNIFEPIRRISILGLSNNTNQQNFTMQDLLGVLGVGSLRGVSGGGMPGRIMQMRGPTPGSRPTGGIFTGSGSATNFLVGPQSGISTTHSFGLNYIDSLLSNLYVNGSYFFNYSDNENPQSLIRQYTLSIDSPIVYKEESDAIRKNYNHRMNLRFEYTPDSSNTFIFTPQLYFQENNSENYSNGFNQNINDFVLSRATTNSHTDANGYSAQNNLVYRYKFPTQGRTLSIDGGLSLNRRSSSSNLYSLNEFFTEVNVPNDTINQKTGSLTKGYSISANVIFTEPVTEKILIQLNYNSNYNNSESDKKTYKYNTNYEDYVDLNNRLSNTFESDYFTNSAGLGLRFREKSLNASMGVSYQIATLRGEQFFPSYSHLSKRFYSILPNLMLNYESSMRYNLRMHYRTSTSSPTITQMQNVVDNSNPLFLSVGNPNLKHSYTHMFLTRFSTVDIRKGRNLLLFFNINYTKDYIGNSTITALKDTIIFPGGIHLNPGTQLTTPINLTESWTLRLFGTYGMPASFLKSNINLMIGLTYNRTPSMLNYIQNFSNTYNFSPGLVIGSNISENLDFTVSYNSNFYRTRNTVQTDLDNEYFSHTVGLRFNWTFWNGFVFKNELNNNLYSGLSKELDQNYVLWNLSFGKKIFKNDAGEILLTVYDVLNQNKSISRNITESYIEDTTSKVLKRYLLLTFTYNLRNFTEVRTKGKE